MDTLKQRVFATAFSSWDPKQNLGRYFDVFEKTEEEQQTDYEVTEFEPENEADVHQMMNAARRAGIIT